LDVVDDSYPPIKRAAWQQLDDDAHITAWDRFYAIYKFDRSPGLTEPVIRDPTPSITFDLGDIGSGSSYAAAVEAINAEAMRCFVSVLRDVDHLLVLGWQHQSFRLDFQQEAVDMTPREWVNGYPTVYPDGHYHAFLTSDLSEGTFGHPWEPSLCIIGERLVETLGATLATWLPTKRLSNAR
jgi:hypothetical protein